MGRVRAAAKTSGPATAKCGRAPGRPAAAQGEEAADRPHQEDRLGVAHDQHERGGQQAEDPDRPAGDGARAGLRRTRTKSIAVAARAAALARSTSAGPSPRPGTQASPWVSTGTAGKNRSD